MFLPSIYSTDCEGISGRTPRAGPIDWTVSLSLTFLVLRHQGARGCPSAESDTHEECLWTQPAGIEKTGLRAQKSFSGVVPTGNAVSRKQHSPETLTLKRCLVQPQAVTSNGNHVSRNRLAKRVHQLLFERPPRPRDASVCPLDTGALIGVGLFFSCLPYGTFLNPACTKC